jgi:glucokinase
LAIKKQDPLCLKVVEKFVEIFGTETGNLALKTLPYGGIYLIGGVTNGIKEYLIKEKKFMESFCDKGRLKEFMKKFKVYLVNPSIEVGLLGAEEKARRELKKKLERL